jgi:hypothetical protein
MQPNTGQLPGAVDIGAEAQVDDGSVLDPIRSDGMLDSTRAPEDTS